jgi:pimeloyl-ACP methyl ester carboxylesterase
VDPAWYQLACARGDAVFEGYCEGLSQAAFNTLLTQQLKMTVENEGAVAGEAYLAPHQSALGRASFCEHQVRHFDSKYTEEISGKLGTLTMPVRILWGEGDQWQPRGYAERLSSDIPDTGLRDILKRHWPATTSAQPAQSKDPAGIS